jgi:hypothetical protein
MSDCSLTRLISQTFLTSAEYLMVDFIISLTSGVFHDQCAQWQGVSLPGHSFYFQCPNALRPYRMVRIVSSYWWLCELEVNGAGMLASFQKIVEMSSRSYFIFYFCSTRWLVEGCFRVVL